MSVSQREKGKFNAFIEWSFSGLSPRDIFSSSVDMKVLFGVRFVWFLYSLTCQLWSWIDYYVLKDWDRYYYIWLAELTAWNNILVICYFGIASYETFKLIGAENLDIKWTNTRRVTYVFFMCNFIMSFTVVLLFWGAVYQPGTYSQQEFALTVHRHGVIAFWTTSELFLHRMTFQRTFVPYLALYYISNLTVNIITTFASGIPVYSATSWDTPISYAWLTGLTILLVLFYWVGKGLTKLRDKGQGMESDHDEDLEMSEV